MSLVPADGGARDGPGWARALIGGHTYARFFKSAHECAKCAHGILFTHFFFNEKQTFGILYAYFFEVKHTLHSLKKVRMLRVNIMSRNVLATLQTEFPFGVQHADGTHRLFWCEKKQHSMVH
jgi:hypothetical protein